MPGVIIRTGAIIKKYVIINSGVIIEHNSIIGEGSHVDPGATILGSVECSACCMIGSRSIVTPEKQIAECSFIKAGSIY